MAPFFARRGLPTSYTCPPKMSEIGLLGAEICVPDGAGRGARGAGRPADNITAQKVGW